MNRRTVLAGTGAVLGSSLAGCLDGTQVGTAGTNDDDTETDTPEDEARAAACSHVPEAADHVEYETAMRQVGPNRLVVGEPDRDDDDDTRPPFALVATAADLERRLRLDALDALDESDRAATDRRTSDGATADLAAFVAETDFESAALLAWQPTLRGSYRIEVAGVVRPERHAIHAYTCRYHLGGGNGTSEDPYTVLVRVTGPERPRRAKLTERQGYGPTDGHDETTYEASQTDG